MKRELKFTSVIVSIALLLSVNSMDFTAKAAGTVVQGEYAIISNESTDTANSSTIGTFSLADSTDSTENSLPEQAYAMDYVKPLSKEIIENKASLKISPNMLLAAQNYSLGDTKTFWVCDFTTESYSQITATLKSMGTSCNVWVYLTDYNMSATDANRIAAEFDNQIKAKISAVFGQPSDVDANGKVNILCYDIKDGFSGSGGYIGGYFDPSDLYAYNGLYNPYTNYMEVFYIDTYPAMGTGSTKDVTQCYGTLAHEFQHMVSFNQNGIVEGTDENLDTWLEEGMSEAATQVYTGQVNQSRINYYNDSSDITNGNNSLLLWDDQNALPNYSLSYLFMEYLKEQAGIGDSVFTQITQSVYNDYRAVESIIHQYIDPNLSFGQFMTNFRAALLLKNASGPYGFKGNTGFNTLEAKIYTGGTKSLYGGGALVLAANTSGNITLPSNPGTGIRNLIVTALPTGVANNMSYNTDRTISFFHGSSTLNGNSYTTGTKVSAEGNYSLVNTISASNITTINFTIDKTAPVISGVENNQTYNAKKIITFNEGIATLNGNSFSSGASASVIGNYTLVVTDAAGNSTTVSFNIPFVYGDVNNSGSVTAMDALLALQTSSGKYVPSPAAFSAADVTKNGSVSSMDALRILQFSTGKITAF